MISFIEILLMLAGLLLLVKSTRWFVDGTAGIAEALHIPLVITGLTILAMGTSAPELAVSFMSVWSKNESVALGDIIGSNITNILLILGICALIGNLKVEKATAYIEIPYMLLVTVLFGTMAIFGKEFSLKDGMVLLLLFGIYIVYLVYQGRKQGKEMPVSSREKKPILGDLFLVLLGFVLVVGSSEMIVESANIIAKDIGLNDRLIGLTIVALATSLPELLVCITAVRRGKTEIAIGNIIGSNIFNLLFVMGTVSMSKPIVFDLAFTSDIIVALLAGAVLWLFVLPKKKLNQVTGTILLLGYVSYVIFRMAGQ